MPKVIIYDFDGTIADTLQVAIAIYNRMALEKGFKHVDKDHLEFFRAQEPRKLAKELGVSLYQIPQLLLRGRKELKNSAADLKIFPGMAELLHKVKNLGRQQAIITSNSEENVKAFLLKNNIDIFDFVLCGNSIFGKAKALKKLMAENQIAPADAVYIGDEVRDIEAARQAKVSVISVSWGFNNKEVLEKNHPDGLIGKPDELLALILGL